MTDYLPAHSMTFTQAGRELTYRDLITDDGWIDLRVVIALAARAADREHKAFQRIGDHRSWVECHHTEYRRVLAIATDMHEAEHARRVNARLPVAEQLRRSIEFELEKAKHGLGMPYDADKVERLKEALEKANSPDFAQAAE